MSHNVITIIFLTLNISSSEEGVAYPPELPECAGAGSEWFT